MRVISGRYRGRVLRSPAGSKTRPTSDRLRETLFNILTPVIGPETRFLDMCAGTGAVGIEALSRGAAFATFIDKSRRSCGLIEENLDLLKIPEEQTEVLCCSAETFAGKPHETGWDIVFFDPPYASEYGLVLHFAGNPDSGILRDGALFIAEHHSKNELPDIVGAMRRWRIVRQGETRLSFYEKS